MPAATAALLLACACAPSLPSPAVAPSGETSGLRLVGWSDLGGGGLNGSVAIFFLPPDRPDPTGVLPAKALVQGVALLDPGSTRRAAPYLVITDIHSGLYVLERNP